MSAFIRRIDEYVLMEKERVKNKQCRICGRDEILKNDIDKTTYGYKDKFKKTTLNSLCKICANNEINMSNNILKNYLYYYEEYISDIKNAINRNNERLM